MTKENQDAGVTIAAEAAAAFAAKKYSETIELADKAFAVSPTLGRAYLAKSLALAQLGDPARGLEVALEGLKHNPSYALLYTAAAICFHRLDRAPEARDYFSKATTLRPDHPQVLYNFACYWAELNDEDRCREFLAQSFTYLKDESFLDEARSDPDLARFAQKEWFLDLIAQVKKRRLEENRALPEPTDDNPKPRL